jgi:hypothetical protein
MCNQFSCECVTVIALNCGSAVLCLRNCYKAVLCLCFIVLCDGVGSQMIFGSCILGGNIGKNHALIK